MVKQAIKIIFACLGLLYFSTVQALLLNGVTEFAGVMQINARTAGVVQSIEVQSGQNVKQGALLLTLDATPFQARYERAQAIASSLHPGLINAQLELDRAQELYDRDSLSQIELKNAENKVAVADGAYKAALADVRLAKYELQQAAVKAPTKSRVMKVHTFIGQYVDPAVASVALVTLVSNNTMKAVAKLNSDQWSAQLVNKKVTVKYRNKVYQGKVDELGYQRIEQAGGLPAYEINITFSTDDLIPAEMPVSIEIQE